MTSPKTVQQILVVAVIRVVLNPHYLRMACIAAAYVPITRIVNKALGISDFRLGHAWYSLEGKLHAPEAASTELRELLTGGRDVIVGTLGDAGASSISLGGGAAKSTESKLMKPRAHDDDLRAGGGSKKGGSVRGRSGRESLEVGKWGRREMGDKGCREKGTVEAAAGSSCRIDVTQHDKVKEMRQKQETRERLLL